MKSSYKYILLKYRDQNMIFGACSKSCSLLKAHRPKIEIALPFRGSWSLSWGTRWRSRKVAGSISDGVIFIFHWPNPSDPTLALVATQPLTEMSTRIVSWGGKGGRCSQLTTLPPSWADCFETWESQPPGTLRDCPGLYRDCFTFLITKI
jgi:hypothetical protein